MKNAIAVFVILVIFMAGILFVSPQSEAAGPSRTFAKLTVDTLLGISVRTTGATMLNGTVTTAGTATIGAPGLTFTLRTIAAGDSVFLHTIVDAADTTLKTWNGSAWVTIQDLTP